MLISSLEITRVIRRVFFVSVSIIYSMTSELDSTKAEIAALSTKIEDVEAGRGDCWEMPKVGRLSCLSDLERTSSLLEKETIPIKQTGT